MKKKYVNLRIISQIFFFILFALILWRSIYPIQGVKSAKFLFAVDPLIVLGVSISQRVFYTVFLYSLIVVVLSVILGRVFCGWVCPLGSMIDFFGSIRNKIINRKKEIYTPRMRYGKFVIFSIVIILALFGIQAVWVGDPITIAGRFISMSLIPFIVNGVEFIFKNLINLTGHSEFLLSSYRKINSLLGGVRGEYFANVFGIMIFWVFIVGLTAVSRRFWCRNLCPLGALLSLFSKLSIFKRQVHSTCTLCGKCVSDCPMGAIKQDNTYRKEECILCMECLYDCPVNAAKFSFETQKKEVDKSRRNFLKFIGVTLLAQAAQKRNRTTKKGKQTGRIIRPPAALKEKDFINRCIRCGNCMRVCVTNGLQPVIMEAGYQGIWTPKLVPEIGECEYQCNMCGRVCPTRAIPMLEVEKKKKTRLGLAVVFRNRCLPWTEEEHCIVCEEHCPVENKAIKLIEREVDGDIFLSPFVDKGLCIGCGTCQNACPVRPQRAIMVDPSYAHRT